MTLAAKATILAILAVGLTIVVQLWPRSRTSSPASDVRGFSSVLAVSLVIVVLALIAVGIVSGTLRIHLVQIAPLVVLAAPQARTGTLIRVAAATVLSWWLVTMAAIWLFLLGLSRFLTGRFSTAEILLTLVIGVACLAGLSASGRVETVPLIRRLPAIALAAGLQSLALWVSYQPVVTGR
jgi:hypothetical protein